MLFFMNKRPRQSAFLPGYKHLMEGLIRFCRNHVDVFEKTSTSFSKNMYVFFWQYNYFIYLCARFLERPIKEWEKSFPGIFQKDEIKERCRSGRTGRTRNPLYGTAVPGVRIPLFPRNLPEKNLQVVGLQVFLLPASWVLPIGNGVEVRPISGSLHFLRSDRPKQKMAPSR